MAKKVHADLDKSVHAQLIHLRKTLGPDATLSDAVQHALAKKEGAISLHLEKNAPASTYFRDKDSRTLPTEIKESSLNLAGLVDLATTLTGRSADDLLAEGLVLACTHAVRDRFRAEAGEANARGASDAKIEAAVKQLQGTRETITPSKVQAVCKVNFYAIKRWFEAHPGAIYLDATSKK